MIAAHTQLAPAQPKGFRQIFAQAHSHSLAAAALVIFIVTLVGMARAAWAQLPQVNLQISNGTGGGASIVQLMVLMTLLTLAPSIVVMVTPFTRIVIVLTLLRNALGTQQSPPNMVIVGLSLFLAAFIMAPVIKQVNEQALTPYMKQQISTQQAVSIAEQPVRGFMLRQTRAKDLALFVNLAKLQPKQISDIPTYVVIPSFMISELKTAFQIGFVIYIPFLVIDMVVASILMSMGMLMVPPVLISLPFKLLLFILADGWNLIFGSIVRSFR